MHESYNAFQRRHFLVSRWECDHNLALTTEVVARRPHKPADWNDLVKTLNTSFSTKEKPVQLKGRGCRERMELLLKKYKDDDKKVLK